MPRFCGSWLNDMIDHLRPPDTLRLVTKERVMAALDGTTVVRRRLRTSRQLVCHDPAEGRWTGTTSAFSSPSPGKAQCVPPDGRLA